MENITSHGGKTVFKTLREFRLFGSLVLMALVAPLLFGCGGGSGETAFVEEPVVSLASGPEVTLAPDGSGIVSVVLDRPAPRNITVGILNSNNPNQFTVPGSVRVGKGQSSAQFTVTALPGAEGASMNLSLTDGNGYSLEGPSTMTVSVANALSLELVVEKDSVPANTSERDIFPGSPYVSQIAFRVTERGSDRPVAGAPVQVSFSGEQVGGLLNESDFFAGGATPQPSVRVTAGQNGDGRVYFAAGTLGGDAVLRIRADSPSETVFIGAETATTIRVVGAGGPVSALEFTGPFIEAIRTNRVGFGLAPGETIDFQNGTYSRVISVTATDANGNPVPANTPIVFRLIDAPLQGFPEAGAGTFAITGDDGNPLEGGFEFSVPTGNFAARGARVGDRLVLHPDPDGRSFYHEGLRVVEELPAAPSSMLPIRSDERPFSVGFDEGARVPYTVGRARVGSVQPLAFTDANGTASTLLTYPFSNVGRTAIIVAETEDGSVSRVFRPGGSVYLGIEEGLQLTSSRNTLPSNATNESVTLCVRDGNSVPLASQAIRFSALDAGGATVDVANRGASGTLTTGTSGCVTAAVNVSGQLPGNEPINLNFFTESATERAELDITVLAPGGGNLTGNLSCSAGTANLLYLNEDGSPISDALVFVSAFEWPSGNPGFRFTPASTGGSQAGVTGANGAVSLRFTVGITPGDYSATIETGNPEDSSFEFVCTVPEPTDPGDPGDLPQARFLAASAALAPGGSAQLAVVLDRPAMQDLTIGLVSSGDADQITVPENVAIPRGASSVTFQVSASSSARDGASIILNLTSGFGYSLGTPASVNVTVNASGVGGFDFFEGSGSDVVSFEVTSGGAVTFETRHRGSGLFFVDLLDQDANRISLLVAETGDTDATVVRNLNPGSYRLGITAGGDWSVRITQPAAPGPGPGPGPDPQPSPEVRFLAGAAELAPGSTTQYALILDRPAASEVTVRLVSSGDTTQIPTPSTVTVPSGASSAVFDVQATASASLGAQVTLSLAVGAGYTLGSPSQATITVVDGGIRPVVRVEGGDKTLSPGQSTRYALVLSQRVPVDVDVSLATVGDISQFDVPDSVRVPAEQSAVNFDISARQAATGGQIDVFIVPGSGYLVGTPQTVTVDVSDGGGVSRVSQLRLSADKVQVVADNQDRSSLEILVQDERSIGIEDVPVLVTVEPSAFDLRIDSPRTDASGRITGTLSSGFDLLSGNALVTAQVGELERTIGIRFVGSILVATPDELDLILGEVQQIQVAARSGADEPATNLVLCIDLPVQLRSDDLEAVPGCATAVRTDGAGIGRFQVEAESLLESGTLRVTALGQDLDIPVTVRPEAIFFTSPQQDSAWPTNEPVPVVIDIPDFTDPVRLGTTSGELESMPGMSTNDALGPPYTDQVRSGPTLELKPGRVTLTVEKKDGSGDRARRNFLAFDPSPLSSDEVTLSISASPRTLRVGSGEVATINFGVQRSDGGAVPPDTLVRFRFPGPSRGAQLDSAFAFVSQEDGIARTRLRAGGEATPEGGVQVEGCVDLADVGETCRSVSVIIADQPAALSIGLANVLESISDDTAYALPISVIATDIGGQALDEPVDISLSVWPVRYAIGLRSFGSPDPLNGAVFVNEDRNRNVARDLDDFWSRTDEGRVGGVLNQTIIRAVCDPPGAPATQDDPPTTNATEAFENGCRLLPASTDAGALESSVVRTDENGLALFRLRYLKDRAEFVTVELRASAQVQGTEVQVSRTFLLPRLEVDNNLPPSPFNAFFDEF